MNSSSSGLKHSFAFKKSCKKYYTRSPPGIPHVLLLIYFIACLFNTKWLFVKAKINFTVTFKITFQGEQNYLKNEILTYYM